MTIGNISLWLVTGIEGIGNVPNKRPFIIVANHASYLDPPIIKSIFDRYFGIIVVYLAKKEIYNNFAKKYFFNSSGTIPVDRQKGGKIALDAAIAKLKEGEVIGLFPEGTRSRDGKLHPGKTGAARLALSARCPIIPVGIINSYELWPPNKKLPKLRKMVVVKIGKPFTLDEYYKKRVTNELLHKITNGIMLRISRLSGQEYARN